MQIFILLSAVVVAVSAGFTASGSGYNLLGYEVGNNQEGKDVGVHFQTMIQHDQNYQSGGYDHYEHVPIGFDGVPLDTPEVESAKAEHMAAHQEAKNRFHTGVSYKDIPIDTQEVHIAKVAHAQAHAVVRARNANVAIQQAYLHQQHHGYENYHH